jgi:hypothetical protein
MNQSDNDINSNSITNNDFLQQRMESLKIAFEKQDIDLNGEIDQNELLNFLDLQSKGGKFDRNLAKHIFAILDIDKNGKISKEEFIKSYVLIIEDVQKQVKELESGYKAEEKNISKLDLLKKTNINEVLNDNQLGPNSKFLIEIININYLKNQMNFDGILIKISFLNKEEKTKMLSLSKNELVWNEKFEL